MENSSSNEKLDASRGEGNAGEENTTTATPSLAAVEINKEVSLRSGPHSDVLLAAKDLGDPRESSSLEFVPEDDFDYPEGGFRAVSTNLLC